MKILVGVSGGIAAYKAAELVRELQKHGADVRVAMTRSAQKFVAPLTFAALTGKPVHTSLWQPSAEVLQREDGNFQIEHITAVQDIDVLVIAPATANILAKFVHGIANDFLTTAYLATTAPVVVAPAMNVNMWQHPAVQANIATLRTRGVHIVSPDDGYLACGMTGSGRLASIDKITTAALQSVQRATDLSSETILITAGGTREPIDPVRFIGNRSSGRMGYALCEAAIARGARTILITSSSLPIPARCDEVVKVSTAEEMRQSVLACLDRSTVVIKAAAVADFRPVKVASQKLRRSGSTSIGLEPTSDIVAEVVKRKNEQTLVIAFAAETEEIESNAYAKLLRKGADAIVANNVGRTDAGFDSDRNSGIFISQDKRVPLLESSKRVMADRILDEVIKMRNSSESHSNRLAVSTV